MRSDWLRERPGEIRALALRAGALRPLPRAHAVTPATPARWTGTGSTAAAGTSRRSASRRVMDRRDVAAASAMSSMVQPARRAWPMAACWSCRASARSSLASFRRSSAACWFTGEPSDRRDVERVLRRLAPTFLRRPPASTRVRSDPHLRPLSLTGRANVRHVLAHFLFLLEGGSGRAHGQNVQPALRNVRSVGLAVLDARHHDRPRSTRPAFLLASTRSPYPGGRPRRVLDGPRGPALAPLLDGTHPSRALPSLR